RIERCTMHAKPLKWTPHSIRRGTSANPFTREGWRNLDAARKACSGHWAKAAMHGRRGDTPEADLGVAKNAQFVPYLRRRHCHDLRRKRLYTIRLRCFVAFMAFVTHRYMPSVPGVGVCNVTK